MKNSSKKRIIRISVLILLFTFLIIFSILNAVSTGWCISALATTFVLFIFFMLLLESNEGWKALDIKMTLGIPRFEFISFISFGGVFLLLYFLSASDQRMRTIMLSLLLSIAGPILAWFIGIKNLSAGCSESYARSKFRRESYSSGTIKEKIEELKKKGLIIKED